jgi:hypothetical protein
MIASLIVASNRASCVFCTVDATSIASKLLMFLPMPPMLLTRMYSWDRVRCEAGEHEVL